MMNDDQIVINEMCLNIPGLDQLEANILGKDVVRLVNTKLKDTDRQIARQNKIGTMNIKVELPLGTPKERLAGIIATQICKSLI